MDSPEPLAALGVPDAAGAATPAGGRARTSRARAAVLGAALLFSTGGVAIKASALDGPEVALGRSAIAALVLFAAMPAWRRFWRPRPLCVGVAYGATMVGFVLANKLTTAANAIFLQSTAPLWVMVLAPVLLREKSRRSDLVLTGVMLLGLAAFFIGGDAPSATAPDPARGNWIAVGTGLAWACTLLGLRWLARAHAVGRADESGAAVVAGNVIGAAACVAFVDRMPPLETTADVLLIGYLGAFQIGLAYVLMTRGVRALPALEVSLLVLVEPVLSASWAWLLLGETPGAFSAIGCAVILGTTAARVLLFARDDPGRRPAAGRGTTSGSEIRTSRSD